MITANQINGLLENTWVRSGPNVPVGGSFSRSPRYFMPILLAEAEAGAPTIAAWNELAADLASYVPATGLVSVTAQMESTKAEIAVQQTAYNNAATAWGIPYTFLVDWSGDLAKASIQLSQNLSTFGLAGYFAPLTFADLEEWSDNVEAMAAQLENVTDKTAEVAAIVYAGSAPTTMTNVGVALVQTRDVTTDTVAKTNALTTLVTGETETTVFGQQATIDESATLVGNILAYINANTGTPITGSGAPFATLAEWLEAQNP